MTVGVPDTAIIYSALRLIAATGLYTVTHVVTEVAYSTIIQEGLAVASIARDVGSSSTNRSSDIMH